MGLFPFEARFPRVDSFGNFDPDPLEELALERADERRELGLPYRPCAVCEDYGNDAPAHRCSAPSPLTDEDFTGRMPAATDEAPF